MTELVSIVFHPANLTPKQVADVHSTNLDNLTIRLAMSIQGSANVGVQCHKLTSAKMDVEVAKDMLKTIAELGDVECTYWTPKGLGNEDAKVAKEIGKIFRDHFMNNIRVKS